jgi:rRNA maturation endonuclease Nob1
MKYSGKVIKQLVRPMTRNWVFRCVQCARIVILGENQLCMNCIADILERGQKRHGKSKVADRSI